MAHLKAGAGKLHLLRPSPIIGRFHRPDNAESVIRREAWRRKASEKPSKEPPTFDELAESVEFDNPEAKEVLSKVTAAAEQVAAAKSKKDDLQKEIDNFDKEAEAERIEKEAQTKADKIIADAELRASEKLVKAAELQLQNIEREKQTIRNESIQDLERIESVKAGAIALVGGAISLAPLIWASGASATSGTLSLLAGLGSCGLFGITYRYAVSADVENRQLKSGVVTAFGLVRALGQADTVQLLKAQEGVAPIDPDVIGPGLLGAGQSVILFGFAAIAIEASFRFGLLKPFGSVGEEQT
ncbi:hypothetical protein BSKO_01496 [Bryopsis sp. KO-2023]|nr:hypothetical protein BSKO_01496 [Bryopsis sp. KO-2023]